jgi:Fe-S cluster assembly protein SufD
VKGDGAVIEEHLARHAVWDANVFAALSVAFVEDGVFLHLPAETSPSAPIELLFVTTAPGVMAQPRVLVVAEPRSRVTVVERYVGFTSEAYFTNVVTEIVAGEGAAVDHYVVQEQGHSAFHVATVHAALDHDSAYSTCGLAFGGQLARTTLTLEFRGEGARGALRGLYTVAGQRHIDNHVTVDHAAPRCSSRQLYKGVLDGSARAVFNGRIIVRPGAQKTDANQTNKHLLLSDQVEVDSKPQLEIFADDVKCTHGAAEGQLAPEALFYLRSRGLSEAAARALLVYGFAREVVDRIEVETLQAYVDRTLTARLGTKRMMKVVA